MSDDSVDIGSDKLIPYEAMDTMQSHSSNKFAPSSAQAGTVSRWLELCISPRAK